jgi:hypothetical protein
MHYSLRFAPVISTITAAPIRRRNYPAKEGNAANGAFKLPSPFAKALLGTIVVFFTFCNFQKLPLALWERVGVRDLAPFGCTAPWRRPHPCPSPGGRGDLAQTPTVLKKQHSAEPLQRWQKDVTFVWGIVPLLDAAPGFGLNCSGLNSNLIHAFVGILALTPGRTTVLAWALLIAAGNSGNIIQIKH